MSRFVCLLASLCSPTNKLCGRVDSIADWSWAPADPGVQNSRIRLFTPWIRYAGWVISSGCGSGNRSKSSRIRAQLVFRRCERQDVGLLSDVLTAFLRAMFVLQRRRARRQGLRGGQAGVVSFIQFFGSTLQMPPHFHSLVLDGVFGPQEGGVRFEPLPPPTPVWSPKQRRRERGVRQRPAKADEAEDVGEWIGQGS